MTVPSSRTQLDRAFRPRSVAVLGASNDPTRISGRALHYLLRDGYSGAIYPVNHKRNIVQGIPAYASLDDVPTVPDIALVALPAAALPDAVRQCADRGVGAAVIFAAGFAETGADGAAAQAELVEIARSRGMLLFGPNCLGLMHAASGFVGTFSSAFDAGIPKGGGVAVVSQSGAYGGHLAYLCRNRGLDVGYWVSTGNEADVDVATCIEWLAHQDDVTVVLAYAEGVRDGARLRRALETARQRRKPVVFLKVGESAAGAVAAASHTASLAGADAVYGAVLARHGAIRARTTQEQVDIAYACDRGVLPRGRRLGVITVSGGFGVQLCDAADRNGLDVAGLPESGRAALRVLNPMGSDDNPCDTTANWLNDMSLITRTFEIMYGHGDYDSVIGSFTMLPGSPTFGAGIRTAIREGTERYMDRPTVLCMEAPTEVVRAYEDAGFLIYDDSERAAAALSALASLHEAFETSAPVGGPEANPERTGPGRPVDEARSRELLTAAGVPFPASRLVRDPGAAAAAAAELGTPLAAKIVSADLPHKTEVGGVDLGVTDAPAAVAQLLERVGADRPDAVLDGVLLSPMARPGVELIVGTNTDQVFGPVVMVGLGGVTAEVFGDVALAAGEVDEAHARRMLLGLRSAPLLTGFRGRPPIDLDAVAALVAAVSRFAVQHADTVVGVELNPVIARPDGVLAVDALVLEH